MLFIAIDHCELYNFSKGLINILINQVRNDIKIKILLSSISLVTIVVRVLNIL